MARQAVSSSIRCWGSIRRASIGVIPKKPESKWSKPSMNAPLRKAGVEASGSPTRPFQGPGSGRPSVTQFLPSSSRLQKDSMSGAPGNRQAMPTIAIGSPSWTTLGGFWTGEGFGSGACCRAGAEPRSRPSSPARKPASPSAVGKSNTTVLGAVYSPARARFMRFLNSTDIKESIPRSKKLTLEAGREVSLRTARSSC